MGSEIARPTGCNYSTGSMSTPWGSMSTPWGISVHTVGNQCPHHVGSMSMLCGCIYCPYFKSSPHCLTTLLVLIAKNDTIPIPFGCMCCMSCKLQCNNSNTTLVSRKSAHGQSALQVGSYRHSSSVFAFYNERALMKFTGTVTQPVKSNYGSSLVLRLISPFCTGMSLSTRDALNNCMQLKQASV